MKTHADLLSRLGRMADAAVLDSRLKTIGYRRPT
jgi:hypothetical protein